jgi:hypothetical protein
MEIWEMISILQKLKNVAIFDNLTLLIVKSIVEYGGVSEMEIINNLGCFEIDGVNDVFQGVKFNVTIQLMLKHVLYVFSVHCMAHHINLAIQTLSGLSLVTKIESLFYYTHNVFTRYLK